MKVILRQDVEKLGEKGTLQNVADGYARNYLIPKGFAILATPGELKVLAENQRVAARKIARQEQQLQSLADRISGRKLTFNARSGEQGRLYGSITAGDIAAQLGAAIGEEIDRRKVVLEEPIRSVGEHTVTVHLVGRLRPQVTVVVHGELDEQAQEAAKHSTEASDAGQTATAEEAPAGALSDTSPDGEVAEDGDELES